MEQNKGTDVRNIPPQRSPLNAFALVRRAAVQAATGYGRSTVYARVQAGLLTRPVSLGGRSVGWPAAEIEQINRFRIAGKSDAEIRALVARLEAQRAALAGPEAA